MWQERYDLMVALINGEIELITRQGQDKQVSTSSLTWTGTQSDLVELIYGLYFCGNINFGNIEIKEIANSFEKFFHIKLTQFYNTFIAIRNRKKERGIFLRKLYDSLIRGMEYLDR